MENPSNLRPLCQPLCYLQGVVLMLCQTHRKGAQATEPEPGIVGTDAMANLLCLESKGLVLLAIGHKQSEHRVGVPDYVLRTGMKRDVDAMGQGLEEKGRGPSVVDDGGYTPRARYFGDGRHVLNFEGQRSG